VADDWQGKGIGQQLLQHVLREMKTLGRRRAILWGGVQSDNQRAVNLYLRNGFRTLGEFEYHGLNSDMILDL